MQKVNSVINLLHRITESTRVRRNRSANKVAKVWFQRKYSPFIYCKFALKRLVMHEIEPFYNWRHLYTAEEDPHSPFFGRTYSEFEYTQVVYNYYIHPQWDEFGSRTLYMKILYADYEQQFVIIEMIGEWNDAIENDIMTLKREVADKLEEEGISKFILITENVLNFHNSDREYYQEWFDEVTDEGGWIVALNMPEQTQYDFRKKKLNYYIELMQIENWRVYKPEHLFNRINDEITKRLEV